MINIEDIKQQLNVNKVLGYYLKGDSSLSGFQKYLSPFKKEKTPSLMGSDQKGIRKDFSSGKGGDIFKFLKDYKGYNFWETLNEFKNIFGIDIDLTVNEFNKEEIKKQLLVYEIHELVVLFCKEELQKNKARLKYLTEKRGLSFETIERFGIGLSFGRNLENYVNKLLKTEKYSIISKNDISLFNNKGMFLFSDRIIYPIRTIFGKIVAFSGGRIYSDQEPKYIHSTNNFVYEKSHNLFNIDKVDFSSRDLFICEGNIDSIQLYNYGGEKSVALLGTSLSETQINLIVNKVDEVTLLLDNDSAGTRAMYEIAKKMYGNGKMVYVFNIGKYKDIDEYLLNNPHLKGNIDNYIDDNKKELTLELLIPSYIKNELFFDIKTRQELFNKIKEMYLSVPLFFDSLKRNFDIELKKGNIDFSSKNKFELFEDLGFPPLTKEQKFDMTGREIQEYNKLRKEFLNKEKNNIKNLENEIINLDKEKIALYIYQNYNDIVERINKLSYGPTIKNNFNKLLEKKDINLDNNFLDKTLNIDYLLNNNPDEFIKKQFGE